MRTEGISISRPTYSKKASAHASQHGSGSQPEVSNKNKLEILQEIETEFRDAISKKKKKKKVKIQLLPETKWMKQKCNSDLEGPSSENSRGPHPLDSDEEDPQNRGKFKKN